MMAVYIADLEMYCLVSAEGCCLQFNTKRSHPFGMRRRETLLDVNSLVIIWPGGMAVRWPLGGVARGGVALGGAAAPLYSACTRGTACLFPTPRGSSRPPSDTALLHSGLMRQLLCYSPAWEMQSSEERTHAPPGPEGSWQTDAWMVPEWDHMRTPSDWSKKHCLDWMEYRHCVQWRC